MARHSAIPDFVPVLGGALALLLVAQLEPRRRHKPTPGVAQRRVVVLGAGFGGLNAALALATYPDIDLTVIDSQNHHLFQPLLYQVATAALSPADIASPVRDAMPPCSKARVMMGAVTGIDTAAQRVRCAGQDVPYDELVVATGSQPSYFGHDEWAAFAPGLKTLHDALDMRGRVLLGFERACVAEDPAERARQLTFVLIGGGSTGVEMAGSIAELARQTVAADHQLSQAHPRVILVEGGDRLLAEFPQNLSDQAIAFLRQLGVEVRTGAKVTAIEQGVVHVDGGEPIHAGTVMWAAGNAATPVAEWLGVHPGKGGRVPVGPDLRVAGLPGVQVIGDAALALDAHGKPLPGVAPVAKQQGRYVAGAILRRVQGRRPPGPFRYFDYGTLATIGRARAVAEFGPVQVSGWPAWALWAVAHIFFLIDFRSRLMVSAQWLFAYALEKRPDRLISWDAADRERASRPPPLAKPS